MLKQKWLTRVLSLILALCSLLALAPALTTEAEAAGTKTKYYNWLQTDPQWGSKKIGSKTIAKVGCAATSVAILMVHSGLRSEDNFDPGTFVDQMKKVGGFSGNLIKWASVSKVEPNFTYQGKKTLSGTKAQKIQQLKKYSNQGYYLIVSVKNETHYVAVRSISQNKVTMMNPGSTKTDLFATYDNSGVTSVRLFKKTGNPSYTVSFNPNGGSVSTTSKKVTQYSAYGSMPTPTRSGYTFDGWYTSANGGAKISPTMAMTANKDRTLYAHWTKIQTVSPSVNQYTFSFNANGGSGSMSSFKATWNNNFTIPLNKYICTGYIFEGWNVKRNGDGKWYVGGQGWLTDSQIKNGGYSKYLYSDRDTKKFDSSWTKGYSGTSSYTFYAVWKAAGRPVADGVYQIVPAVSGSMVLDVAGAKTANGTNVCIWQNKSGKNQAFNVKYLGNGYYLITDYNSGSALDVAGRGTSNKTNVQIWKYDGSANQQWIIRDAGGGYYNVIARHCGLYLDVNGGKTDNGTNVQIYQGNGSNAQKFKFVRYSAPSTSTSSKPASTLKIGSDFDGPSGTKTNMTHYGLRGTITSNYKITKVYAKVTDNSTGKIVTAGGKTYEYSKSWNSTSYNIRNDGINDAFAFGKLPAGKTYSYYVQFVDASGKSVSKQTTFTKKS